LVDSLKFNKVLNVRVSTASTALPYPGSETILLPSTMSNTC
jgi:hypothetical protein